MSVVSKNIFDLLGDDGDDSPSPAPAPAAKKPAAPTPAAPARAVPGSAQAPRGGAGAGGRGGRGSYPSRGARAPREPRDAGFIATEANVEGTENAGGFDGERVPPSRKANHTRDAHTKGPRGTRPTRGGDRSVTSGGHSAFGTGHYRGNKVPSGAGERGRFERKNLNGGNDSQKKVEHGWGANTGEAELKDEVEGEKDAQVEENQPQTPAPEGADGGWDAPEETAAPAAEAEAAPAEPEEPEEVTKSYDEYLAERAQQQIAGLGKKQAREVSSELEGQQFVRQGIDEFFSGKAKTSEAKAKAKKEKVYIEVDGQFARPQREDRPQRTDRGERGERGERGARGGGRGRGGPRGGFGGERGTGAPRGSRGGARGGRAPAGINANDTKAFPALGA